MKKYMMIVSLLFLSACKNEDIQKSVKNCLNELSNQPSEAVFDKCFYYENEFQRQLSINFENVLPKLFNNYGGISEIKVDILNSSNNSAEVQIITKFNNGFVKNEKRKMVKIDNLWKMSADIIK
ncbi:DUF4878 domain-containing protein [Campylobacter sp. RM9333]|uniref:hypothetical protein n=1 Tax=Campylobacter sp. RM9333 TaxID=2735731 RepID=UPI001D69229C|nr:DUF4878 domain-containing protein [Campylobacter sp. RM9333]